MSSLKQTDEPLFPEILWNQPVNKRAAGHILIIGGHSQQFSRVQDTYQAVTQAGAGKVTVILPKTLHKITGALPDCIFVPDTPAGSLARSAETEIRRYIAEVDTVLLPGELSQNTETIGLLETLLQEDNTPFIITDEIIRSILPTPYVIKPPHVLVATPRALSDVARTFKIPIYVASSDLQKEKRLLTALSEQLGCDIVCHSREHILVSSQNQISITPVENSDTTTLAALATVFYTQHAQKFEALTTAAWQMKSDF